MELGGGGGDPPQQHQNTGFFSEGADAALNPSQANARFVPITKNENHKAQKLQTHAIRCRTPAGIEKPNQWKDNPDFEEYPGGDENRIDMEVYNTWQAFQGHAGPYYDGPTFRPLSPYIALLLHPQEMNGYEWDTTVPDPSKM